MYPDTAEQEEEDTGSAPRSAEPRTETHTPPTQPPGTEGEGEENDTAESANTEPDQTVEDVSQTSDEARHRFHHGENTAAQQTGTIHCPVCPRTWTSRARRQQQTSHLNTTHAREVVRVDALKATGVDRCLSCGEFVIASGNARRAHGQKCGEFVTRAVRNQKRARTEQSTPRQDAVAEPTPETPPPPTRHRTRPTEADAEWVQEFPATIRTLRKQEWGHWAEAVGHTPPRLHRGGRRGTLPAPARAYRAGAHSSRQTARTSAGGGREPPRGAQRDAQGRRERRTVHGPRRRHTASQHGGTPSHQRRAHR
ncbi:SLACS-associated protein, putative [Leishmania panamensis]|uniref:SLACS-associated protein, putative n=1 Tax=Leishmania panamensis TaxID=5679 RepID=A0AC62A6J8_LEIPA